MRVESDIIGVKAKTVKRLNNFLDGEITGAADEYIGTIPIFDDAQNNRLNFTGNGAEKT